VHKLSIVSILISLFIALFAATVATAQADVSAGCLASQGLNQAVTNADPDPFLFDFVNDTFDEGDVLTVTVTTVDAGVQFLLRHNGAVVVPNVNAPDSLSFTVPTNGTAQFQVDVTGVTTTATITVDCEPAPDVEDPLVDGPPFTLCHFPPGNPAAAHTITVGSRIAAEVHMGHGDTAGACAPQQNTLLTIVNINISIFTIPQSGQIEIYGLCEGDECSPVALINANLLIPDEGFQLEVDEDPSDAWEAIVYYLHPYTFNDEIKVFQVNLYENDTLQDDSLLIFVLNGEIIAWNTHDAWQDENFITFLNNIEINIEVNIHGDDSDDSDDDDDTQA